VVHLASQFELRRQAALTRIDALGDLRRVVGLPRAIDLDERGWRGLQRPLDALRRQLRLSMGGLGTLAAAAGPLDARQRSMSYRLGRIELEISKAFTLYDTYMDILTQRHSPLLGPLLRGCDILALDALDCKGLPTLSRRAPLVYCDRGFGASILRSSIRLFEGILNSTPLIQIPYARLKELLHLTSICHEVGHEALSNSGIAEALADAIAEALEKERVPADIIDLYRFWSSEIGPDFWGFLCSGSAQSKTITEILALPPDHAFRITPREPHPPAYLRALLSFAWCRHAWGGGPWDAWEKDWRALYPLSDAPQRVRGSIEAASAAIPVVTQVLFTTRFRASAGKALPELFDVRALRPKALAAAAEALVDRSRPAEGERPCVVLAQFRSAHDRQLADRLTIERLMAAWLHGLAARRPNRNHEDVEMERMVVR
jgi:hypothetical protein